MFVISLRTRFYLPTTSISLVLAVRPKAKYKFCALAVFYLLERISTTPQGSFLQATFRRSVYMHHYKRKCASVIPTSQFCATATLLQIVGSYEVGCLSDLQLHSVYAIFFQNRSARSKNRMQCRLKSYSPFNLGNKLLRLKRVLRDANLSYFILCVAIQGGRLFSACQPSRGSDSNQGCDATIDFRHCSCFISFMLCVFYPCPFLFFFIMLSSSPAHLHSSCHHLHYSLGHELVIVD